MNQKPESETLFDPSRARRLMDAAGIDLLLASRRASVAYLTDRFGVLYWEYPEVAHCLDTEDDGCQMPFYFVGLPADLAKPFVVAHDNRVSLFKGTWVPDVRAACWQKAGQSPVDCLVAAISERKLESGRIGVEMNNLPAVILDALRQRLPRVQFVDAGMVVWQMRAVKTPRELDRQRQAYRIAEEIYAEVLATIGRQRDLTVGDIRALQMAMATKAGCPPIHFGYVFPQDGDRKRPWDYARAGTFRFEPGDVILMDLGLIWKGYTTDFGRNAVLGKIKPELRDLYDRTVQCRQEIATMIVPGARVSDVATAAAKVRQRLKLPERSSVGHSLGIECHEQPTLSANYPTIIEEGMTLVIELCEGLGHIAFLLEDAGLVTAQGWQSLTKMSTELVEID